ncbi:hypothetical protein D3C81_1527420 [compost metagenome]
MDRFSGHQALRITLGIGHTFPNAAVSQEGLVLQVADPFALRAEQAQLLVIDRLGKVDVHIPGQQGMHIHGPPGLVSHPLEDLAQLSGDLVTGERLRLLRFILQGVAGGIARR